MQNYLMMSIFVISFVSAPCGAQNSQSVLDLVPTKFKNNPKRYSEGIKRLHDIVRQCGYGVVRNPARLTAKNSKNSCAFQVNLDELFFTPMSERTGLIQERDWAYADGVTWFMPNMEQELPERFDLRELMKSGQPEIRAQKCGDCWAWSTHHGLEIARAIHDNEVIDHSIQTVLSCSNQGSCNGGYMSAVDFLKYGLPPEPDFPYAASDRSCKYSRTQINTGWDGKVQGTPYVGSSMRHSLAKQLSDGTYLEGSKVTEMIAAMHEWQSPLVVTVAAFDISGSGIYSTCSAINSGGDHMVAISGWELVNGKRIAHVWNSWGLGHGENGVSRIQWECGDGKLNRGLGVSAKIVQYKTPCTPPSAAQTYMREIQLGNSVQIGAAQSSDVTCSWTPTEGLSNPNSCETTARPTRSTEYHLSAQNRCGTSSSMTLVHVWPAEDRPQNYQVLTPFGVIQRTNH
jgi:hypothetical protein